ncbi:phosphopantetheine-binding protein [Sphaerisporangium sp. B11E5]|uniref:phosphopantetheine-binding protein n=1 Tax=Sphaerisporangium sp. B11E5 TaxID=3153563 RepID=UPI00325EB676
MSDTLTGEQPGATETPPLEQLREIWRDVLKLDDVGPDDELPYLGGQSMQIIQLAVRVERTLGVKLPLQVLVEATTLRGVAEAAVELRRPGAAR